MAVAVFGASMVCAAGRDATRQRTRFLSRSYRGGLNQIGTAQKDLYAVVQAAPHSHDAYAANELLANLYFRNGLYEAAFVQVEAMLTERPTAEDVKNMRPLF